MENREAEFQVLEKHALGILTDEAEPNENFRELTVAISVTPSFGDYKYWKVFADTQETRFVVRKTVWCRVFDSQRFRNPLIGLKYGWNTEPTISSAVSELPSTTIRELLFKARSLDIPDLELNLRRIHAIVLDGTRWFVYVTDAFGNKSHLWNALPPELEPVALWTEQLVTVLDSVVNMDECKEP